MKERAIISIILLLLAYTVCGCEEEQPVYQKLGTIHIWDDVCGKELVGTYGVEDGYWFKCSTCQTVYSNAQWARVGNKKYIEMFGIDLIGGEIELSEPNEARYKAWFGW